MNSSYSLEKLGWERQEDLRREAQSIQLISLRPGSAHANLDAIWLLRLSLALCAAVLAALLIG